MQVRPLQPCQVWLRFEDGVEGVVDLAHSLREETVFDRLRDPKLFRQVRILRGFGTVEWPGGIDFDPDVLCKAISPAGNPELATVLRVVAALGLRLRAELERA